MKKLRKEYRNSICEECFYLPGCIEDGFSIFRGSCPIGVTEEDILSEGEDIAEDDIKEEEEYE